MDDGRLGTGNRLKAHARCDAGDKSSPDENKRGIIPNAFQHIFNQIDGTQGRLKCTARGADCAQASSFLCAHRIWRSTWRTSATCCPRITTRSSSCTRSRTRASMSRHARGTATADAHHHRTCRLSSSRASKRSTLATLHDGSSLTVPQKVMMIGNNNRSVGVTDMNAHSSRSHAIFVITVECSETHEDGENHIRCAHHFL